MSGTRGWVVIPLQQLIQFMLQVEAQKAELSVVREDLEKLQVREKHTGAERTGLQERESQLQMQLSTAQAKLDLLETECKELHQEVCMCIHNLCRQMLIRCRT